MKLSIIINDLNDHMECRATIQSIRTTSPAETEIIVVDDGSTEPLVLDDPSVILIRNDVRAGGGPSRHQGAEAATGDYLLLIDSHMRFAPGWYAESEKRIVGRSGTVHCASCMGLSEGNMDLVLTDTQAEYRDLPLGAEFVHQDMACRKTQEGFSHTAIVYRKDHVGRETRRSINAEARISKETKVQRMRTQAYSGATFNFFGKGPNGGPDQVLEGVWKTHTEDDCEMPCLMGACYFFPRELFFRIGGLKGLKEWGSEEPLLSLKTWLSGYEIRFMKNVRIGHKFRSEAPYATRTACLVYNKLRVMMTCLSTKETKFLAAKFPKDAALTEALKMVEADRKDIQKEKKRNAKMFQHDLRWLCDKFRIPYPA